jgi:iron complex outermembrane receptor protein
MTKRLLAAFAASLIALPQSALAEEPESNADVLEEIGAMMEDQPAQSDASESGVDFLEEIGVITEPQSASAETSENGNDVAGETGASAAAQLDGADKSDQKAGLPADTSMAAPTHPADSAGVKRSNVALEEIVVTARKRTENLQDVPVSVTSVSSEEMRANNISNIADVARIAPGLDQREGRKQGAFAIRGVGQVRTNELQADPGVGVYIDGIFLARNDSQLLDALTLQSVQVLRGPQGTLFGKNTIGGAILVTTKAPNDEFAVSLGTKLDGLGQRDAQIAVDVPIIDGTLYSKLTLGSVRSDGYAEDNDTGRRMGNDDRQIAALQLLWNISDNISLKTLANFSRQNDNIPPHYCQQITLVGAMSYARAPGRDQTYSEVCSEAELLIGKEKVSHENVVSGFTSRDALIGTTLTWDTWAGTIKSITSYAHKGHSSQDFDFDATDLLLIGNTSYGRQQLREQGVYDKDDSRTTVSQELQFTGNALDERLQYTVGLFGSLESLDNQLAGQLATPEGWVGFEKLPGLPDINSLCLGGLTGQGCLYVRGISTLSASDYENTSYALFSQASYNLTPSLQFTAGLRYTLEKRDLDLEQFGSESVPPLLGIIPLPGLPITVMTEAQFNNLQGNVMQLSRGPQQHGSVDFERLSPMASLSWNVTDGVEWQSVDSLMVYATVAEGFKSGGFNILSSGIDTYKPEYVISSELGFKLDALSRSLRLNVALYNSDYRDVQVVVAKIPSIGAPEISTNNAGLARMRGAEAELAWLLSREWMINLSGNYIDAEFLEYDDEVLDPVTSQPAPVDRSSEPFPFIPRYSYNVALRYHAPPVRLGEFDFMLSRNTRAEQFIGGDATAGLPQFRDQATIDGFSVWTARATWNPWDDGRLRVALYGNNLTNEDYVATGSAVYSGFGTNSVTIGKVRHFGLEINYEFR